MKLKTQRNIGPQKQQGAALVVGLILLLILTVFAVSGMSTATLELVLAGNTQFTENAFQASESAIEAEFIAGPATPTDPRTGNFTFNNGIEATTDVTYRANTFAEGYSISEYSADHYIITARGTSGKNAVNVNQQGFYIVVPGAGTGQ
ncbi:MAG: PilX N-terminal domain-containing pilus assembly protein [Gammaproteobacteria bacterium]